MRFQAVHKLASYCMVAASLCALALSGELSYAVVGATALFGLLSYFFEPNEHAFLRHRFYTVAWNTVTLAVFAGTVLWAIRTDALGAGVRFLCFLVVNKLWNRRASRDYLQAYVVSFLMLVAGAAMSSELSYAICFVAYVVFATWTLTLFHLRREMEENYLLKHSEDAQSERVEVDRVLNSRRIVGGAFLAGTSLVSAGIFLLSAILFFLIPRVGFGLFAQGGRRGRATAGFSDRVELGQYGRIKDNPQVVLRVEMDAPPGRALRFRGVSFDRYEKGRWTRTPRTGNLGVVSTGGLFVIDEETARADGKGTPHRTVPQRLRTATKQVIYLEPLDTPVLFGLTRPFAFELSNALAQAAAPMMLEMRGRDPYVVERRMQPDGRVVTVDRQGGLRYTVWSEEPVLDETSAVAARVPATYPGEIRPYLALPADLPPRIAELAHTLTVGEEAPYLQAVKIEKYLQTQLRYTLDLERDERFEPLEDFLFTQKRGHCEYFASALAVMLRTLGIPSRSVNGFYGGEWNEYGHYVAIRQGDAHAWVEAWFDGVGWVTFDPTPAALASEPRSSALATLRRLFDNVELAWFKWVIDYDLAKQAQMVQKMWSWTSESRSTHKDGPSLAAYRRPIAYGVGGVLVLVAAILAWRRRPAAGPPRSRAQRRLDRVLDKILSALERRGYAKRPGDTLHVLQRKAELSADPIAAPLEKLVARYYAARFGGEDVPPEELEALAQAVLRAHAERPRGPSGPPQSN